MITGEWVNVKTEKNDIDIQDTFHTLRNWGIGVVLEASSEHRALRIYVRANVVGVAQAVLNKEHRECRE